MTTTTGAPVTARDGVGWGDLLWLTWRQHRWVVVGTAAATACAAGSLVLARAVVRSDGPERDLPFIGTAQSLASAVSALPTLLGLVVAMFWGAPLLAREYEQRTHLVVWSQDLSAARWLLGKVALLSVVAAGMAAVLGVLTTWMVDGVNPLLDGYQRFNRFEGFVYDAAPALQIAYALFGLALGVALSALIRRTLPAVALAGLGFLLVRGVMATGWRPYFQTPVRRYEPVGEGSSDFWAREGRDALHVSSGYADAAGDEVEFPMRCVQDFDTDDGFDRCLADLGITQYFTDYQPADRLAAFQFTEVLIFLAATTGLLVLAYLRVRRSQRV